MIKLREMSYHRSDAIDKCVSLGECFIDYFNKIMNADGLNDPNFDHHCSEMSSWFNTVNRITLKPKNKLINSEYLMDWFFTCGSSIDIIIPDKFEIIYSDFVSKLLANRKNVDIIRDLTAAIVENS